MVDRVPTGIHGLDPLIEGGFLRGDIILLAGNTGTGKTIFCTQYIHHGAAVHGEKGIYASFEEDEMTLKRDMGRLGFDLGKLEHKGALEIIDLIELEALKDVGLRSSTEYLLGEVDRMRAKRFVIDSLTAFLTAYPVKFEYRTLMHLFTRAIKKRGCTTVLTCSLPIGSRSLGLGIEEFVADAVITLESTLESQELKTRLMIHKMRGTKHSKRYHEVMITRRGMEIIPSSYELERSALRE
ncbi:MAG: RAD55 family ATPase [Candidatus Bathyarchaeia archaeon]